ncbi:hypothetical protein [Agrobacterium tumefaciens]|uniref:hypothetical protein n=1 Tax=Agrobacterium tumefaciens TaxID=358 RepID=UPI0004595FC7|nr:hypothetical protein [Agrobacterium tumefaciens]CDN94221.1 hypothetical protein BN949_03388 [Agrobacterium tumefaciens]
MITDLFAYSVQTLDVDWETLTPCNDYRAKLATVFCKEKERSLRRSRLADLQEFEDFYWEALDAGRRAGSEGRFLVEPHMGFLPETRCMSAYLVWKDDVHGITYFVSPVEMPWLHHRSRHGE